MAMIQEFLRAFDLLPTIMYKREAEPLLERLGPEDAEFVPEIIERLTEWAGDPAWEQLKCFSLETTPRSMDPSSRTRFLNARLCSWALGKIGGPALPAIRRLLQEEHPGLRRAGLFALEKLSIPRRAEATGDLGHLLHDEISAIRYHALEVLHSLGPAAAAAVADLAKAMRNTSGHPLFHFHFDCASALRGVGAAAVPALIEATSDADRVVRQAAVWALGEMAQDQRHVLDAVRSRLTDEDEEVRRTALEAFERLSSSERRHELLAAALRAAEDASHLVQSLGLEMVGKYGTGSAAELELILRLLDEPSLAGSAASALMAMGEAPSDPRIEARLISILQKGGDVPLAVIHALGRLGTSQAEEALKNFRDQRPPNPLSSPLRAVEVALVEIRKRRDHPSCGGASNR